MVPDKIYVLPLFGKGYTFVSVRGWKELSKGIGQPLKP